MSSLKILIVEDEILIAETIRLYLEEKGHIVQDICISYREAIRAIEREQPDLVVLDVRLYGEKSGIDVAKYIKKQAEKIPFIYLTSQYDQRIFNLALETVPFGYLAKPIQKESLLTTIETAHRLFQQNELSTVKSIIINDGFQNHRVKEQEILYIKSDHIYVNIYLANREKITIRKSLQDILDIIKSQLFFQCHRSYIVNTLHVNGWNKSNVVLVNGEQIPVSRTKRKDLEDLL
ncbi:MAG: LytR/AlgR family response regulator transcription factor [Saprospiraceae bacterium]